MSLRTLTHIYYLGLGCGFWNKGDVINWSDKVIEQVDEPPIELIDVSMMSESYLEDVERKLVEFCGVMDKEYSVKILCSAILDKVEKQKLPIGNAITIVNKLMVNTELYLENQYNHLYSFKYCYDLALDRVVQKQPYEVESEFAEELKAMSVNLSDLEEMYAELTGQSWGENEA
ncbi:protein kinase [Halobacillus litoralis]|uniref:protein kinase n=1 Tax=Halobacillus litoralis TaxID=45668 RepID=UPI001CD622AD|nr:protein kinase [Halobacillus litoralis]MCA0971603.1 protein kinase [Halobacillus litoralis]